MTTITQRVKHLFERARAGDAATRGHFPIPSRRVLVDGAPAPEAERFRPRRHYFQVQVNEMFLATPRQWFVRYAPMVFVAASYIYNGREETSPFVVGPS